MSGLALLGLGLCPIFGCLLVRAGIRSLDDERTVVGGLFVLAGAVVGIVGYLGFMYVVVDMVRAVH